LGENVGKRVVGGAVGDAERKGVGKVVKTGRSMLTTAMPE
jgi:hypothetical protein